MPFISYTAMTRRKFKYLLVLGDGVLIVRMPLKLSKQRAEQVLGAVSKYASDKGVKMDASQIQPVGVGIREPFIAKPSNLNEAKQNMRVEFRIIRVPAEATNASDFDF